MDELTIGDKIYISSKRAAALTGYAKDYIGQLCREGHVEAKMVGRSWYVLESSIRAHRFGEEPQERPVAAAEAPKTVESPLNDLPDTWVAPTYTAEEVPAMPVFAPETALEPYEEEDHALVTEDETESLSEMQAAWKEWFETKQVEPAPIYIKEEPEPVLEPEEEVTEEVEEAEQAVPIAVHKIQPIRQTYPGKMDISPIEAPVAVPIVREAPIMAQAAPLPPRPIKRPKERVRYTGSNLVTTALLVALALIVMAVAYIGSGFGSPYISSNPVFEFLGGTSSIQK